MAKAFACLLLGALALTSDGVAASPAVATADVASSERGDAKLGSALQVDASRAGQTDSSATASSSVADALVRMVRGASAAAGLAGGDSNAATDAPASRLIRQESRPRRREAEDSIPTDFVRRPWALVQQKASVSGGGGSAMAHHHKAGSDSARDGDGDEDEATSDVGVGDANEDLDSDMQGIQQDVRRKVGKKALLARIRKLKAKLSGRSQVDAVSNKRVHSQDNAADGTAPMDKDGEDEDELHAEQLPTEVSRITEDVAALSRHRSQVDAVSLLDSDDADDNSEEDDEEDKVLSRKTKKKKGKQQDKVSALQQQVKELKEAMLAKKVETTGENQGHDTAKASAATDPSDNSHASGSSNGAVEELRREFAQLREELRHSSASVGASSTASNVAASSAAAAEKETVRTEPQAQLQQRNVVSAASAIGVAQDLSSASLQAWPAANVKAAVRAELQEAEKELDEAAKRRVADLETKVARLRSEAVKESAMSFLEVGKETTLHHRHGRHLQTDAEVSSAPARRVGDCAAPEVFNKVSMEPYIECIGGTCENADASFIKGLLGVSAGNCKTLLALHDGDCNFDLSMGYSDVPDATPLGWLCNQECPKTCASFFRHRSERRNGVEQEVVLMEAADQAH